MYNIIKCRSVRFGEVLYVIVEFEIRTVERFHATDTVPCGWSKQKRQQSGYSRNISVDVVSCLEGKMERKNTGVLWKKVIKKKEDKSADLKGLMTFFDGHILERREQ